MVTLGVPTIMRGQGKRMYMCVYMSMYVHMCVYMDMYMHQTEHASSLF